MVAWFTAAFKAVYTVVSTAVTVAAGVVCPPLGAVAAGAFALGGQAINQALTTGDAVDDQKYQHQRVMNSLSEMNNSFVSMNGTLVQTQDMVRDLQVMLNMTAEETKAILGEIQVVLANNAEENRKMMKEILTTLKQFENKMEYNFKALQSFLVELDFKKDYLKKVKSVWYWMNNAMTSQDSKYPLDKFKEVYQSSKPHMTLVDFAMGLDDTMMNPVVSAMEAHVLKSNFILENYMQVFSNMIVQVLAIEGFYCGVAEADNTESCMKEIFVHIDYAIARFQKHVTSHKIKEELYWPTVVQQVIDSNLDETDITVTEMTERVHRQLEGIRTTDVFSIYSWMHIGHEQGAPQVWTLHTVPHGPNMLHDSRFTGSTEMSKWRNLIVARSATFHDVPHSQFDLEQTAYRTYALTEERWFTQKGLTRTYKDSPNAYMHLQRKKFHTSLKEVQGFFAFNVTPAVRYTNNGYSILRDEDINITSSPRVYIGMSWY